MISSVHVWYKFQMSGAFSVAIIDDEEHIRRALSRLLNSVGMNTRSYASAQEFLAFYKNRYPDCVIVDLQMRNFNGFELVTCLRQLGVKLPIIMITAYDDPSMREKCISAGADAYLYKPLDDQVLLDAITNVCESHH